MNSLTTIPDPAGQWFWDGSQWVCGNCPPPSSGQPCPPFPVVIQPPFPPPFLPPPVTQPPWYPGANGGVSFGTTAPPNPIRGAFWWDGSTLHMFDGAAWVGVGGASGGGTPPSTNPPANPANGQQWFNGTTLFVWDGNAWVPVAGTQTFVQATAPPSPVPGDLWFDGTQLRIWSGSAWNLVGPGATVGSVATTTQVLAVVQSGYFNAPATWGVVTITTTPQIDTQTGWDPNTHKYTPKLSGVYLFQSTVWAGSGGGIAIVKNDTGVFVNDQNTPSLGIDTSSALGYLQVSTAITHMNGTTDFVRLFGFSAGQFWGNPTPSVLGAYILP